MQHSPAGLRAPRPATRFVGPAAHDRVRNLGLRRHAFGMITARPSRAGVAGGGISRSVLRDRRVLTIVPSRREVSGTLRRQPRLAWASESSEAGRWTVPSTPTSWGG